MTRPHPVVGLAAELSYGCRRRAHETYVGIFLIDDYVVNVPVVEGLELSLSIRDVSLDHLAERVCGCDESLALKTLKVLGDVGHTLEEKYGESRNRELFAALHCPVAILEVVVLRGRKALDAAVAAVVVSYEETLVRDYLSGAAAAELDDCILEGRVVDVIDVFCRQFAAHVLHDLAVHLLEQRQKPHALISPDTCCKHEDCCDRA